MSNHRRTLGYAPSIIPREDGYVAAIRNSWGGIVRVLGPYPTAREAYHQAREWIYLICQPELHRENEK